MKKILILATCLLLPALTAVFSQETPNAAAVPSPMTGLTRFNLDFDGGPPIALVDAIEKATGKTLNVVIPQDGADVVLPPLKMNNVNVENLFAALEMASHRTVTIKFDGGYRVADTSYGFASNGPAVTDDSIWSFHASLPVDPPPTESVCRFYSLAPYLDRGFTVDDITTAINTGWDMESAASDSGPKPVLSFHKETKLLIAVGNPRRLEMIDQALKALPATNVSADDIDKMKATISDLQAQLDKLTSRLDNPPDSKTIHILPSPAQ